jgi:hypothetical protein
MRHFKKLLLTLFLISTAISGMAQTFTFEKLMYGSKYYKAKVINNSNDSFINENQKRTIVQIIPPIENGNSLFEIRKFDISTARGNYSIRIFKIEKGIGYIEMYSFKFSRYRLKDIYPDSISADSNKILLLRKISKWKIHDTLTKKILMEFLKINVFSMDDQSKFIENYKNEGGRLSNPCATVTDCNDFLIPYEIKLNKTVRRFNRVGLDYYKFNESKKLEALKLNPILSQIIDERLLEILVTSQNKK